ncbi:MAG: RNase adapter RapZ [Defluviitaleaceae bacterium]|nr:RNase adapter RapZ [Defluviitaleaceae bacterium]
MQFIIVTGMSGAGKSTVLRFLEDIGYFCADNLPPELIQKFAEVCFKSNIEKAALGIDIRGGRLFDDFFKGLSELSEEFSYKILYLDASDDTLITRYKETRRNHPLSRGESLDFGIIKEREILAEVKKSATYIIDTSQMLARHLKEKINEIFALDKQFSSLMITVLSFGFKYGIPKDSDLVFDVRFIPNPFYEQDLKHKTGNDIEVNDFVMSRPVSSEFLHKLEDMLGFLIPNYVEEGKNQLVIAIGCTGGKHRSVTIANKLYNSLQNGGQSVIIKHRDVEKDGKH